MAEDVPAFDDIPSFDDLPDEAPASQQSDAVPAFDDIPSFDALPDDNSGRPAPETALGTGVREAARAVVPTGAGLVGAGLGGAAAGALGAGPVGAFIGGVGGMLAASMGAGYVQDKALDAAGFDDAEQRAANIEAHPVAAFAGGLAPGVASMSPIVAGRAAQQVMQRGAGAVIGGAFEAGQDLVNEGHVDPTKAAAAAAVGAVFPGVNRVGQKFVGAGERLVPGRPNRTANPAADQAHVDVDDANAQIEVGNSSLAQTAHPATGNTTGNPQSAPQRSARVYSKGVDPAEQARYAEAASDPEAMRQFAFDEGLTEAQAREIVQANYRPEADMLTRGQADPATVAALEAANPAPVAAAPEGAPAQPAPQPAAPPRVARPTMPEPSVEAGFPQAGEPVAMGANDATPLPPGTPERAAKAIKQSKKAQREAALQEQLTRDGEALRQASFNKGLRPGETEEMRTARLAPAEKRSQSDVAAIENAGGKVTEGMPELKGETPINDSITEAQRAAGNYPKARTHDFGKPQKIETHAGDIRRGKGPDGKDWEVELPYDYGYFNKTKGADKDHIDFARPKAGSPEEGNRFFIIDQKNAETGKFDEHKLFTYYKDEAAARAHYEAGFSDGKGADRLGAITEVTRPELVKFLAKHTSKASTKPFGDMPVEAPARVNKPVKERAVVKDLVQKLEAQGKTEEAKKLLAAPDEQVAAAIEGKRVRKYGVGTGASAGYPVEGVFTSDGRPVTANTKAKATERAAAHKKVADWFEKTKAPENPDTESNGALLDRIKQAAPNIEGWKPSHKPKEWLLAREAQKVLMKPTPGNIKKFREAERLLRGDDASVEAYRGGNRVEADIAQSRRSGDDAIAAAEAKQHLPGTNAEEDAMIAAIDAKQDKKSDYWSGLTDRTMDRVGIPKKDRPKFDIPHEEAEAMVKPTPVKTRADLKELPKKTVSSKDSSLAKIDTKAISAAEMRKAEAAKLAGRKSTQAAGVESEGAAAPVRQIKVTDPNEIKRLTEMLSKAAAKKVGLDALPAEPTSRPRGIQDLLGDFVDDSRGSVDIGKIKADMKAWMGGAFTRTEPESYRAMSLKTNMDKYAQKVSDDLQSLKKGVETMWVENLKRLEAIPKEFKTKEAMAKIYHARDADSAHFPLPAGQKGTHVDNLPPALKKVYDEHLKPLLDENDQFVAAIRSLDPDRVGPDVASHISRITKGDEAKQNLLKQDDDPTAPSYHGLAVNADSAKTRRFYALVGADGRRHVIAPSDAGFTKWDKYKAERIKDPNFAFEDGKTYQAGPNTYTMRQATTKEIEANARGRDGKPMKYYDNAGFSAAVSNTQLGAMMRNLADLHAITQTPEFKKYSTHNEAKAKKMEPMWEESNLPNMKGTYLHPELKKVFDDFAGNPQSWYTRFNSTVTKLIFWMPVAHINNVGTHWFVGRGWDNFSVPANVRLAAKVAPRAIKSVVNQDAYQAAMRDHGAGLIYGSVKTRRMIEQVAKRLGMEIEQNPGKWGPIADKLGITAKQLYNAVYDTSSKVMWSAGDVFLTMRVMELEAKGMPLKKAIIEAERDIPNYRVPHQIIGRGEKGRSFSKLMTNSTLTAFGRYHYGMFNSYANIIKDALHKDSTAGDRLDAIGKLMSMGALAFMVYPILDKGAQLVTGNEEAKAARRGPTSVPSHIGSALKGETDASQWARGAITLAPALSAGVGALSGKDFRGKPIIEPGDLRGAAQGNPKQAARVAASAAEYAAKTVVSPYGVAANALQRRKPGESATGAVAKAVRDATLDIKDPTDKAIKYKRMTPIRTNREAISRFKHGGAGPLENLIGKATGYR